MELRGVKMKHSILTVLIFLLAFYGTMLSRDMTVRLATTTSTENSGLLDKLLPPFEKQFGIRVQVISSGTGKALKLAENGDVDAVLVHARPAEDRFIEKGYGLNRRDVMHNDFILLGPAEDPADVQKAADVRNAFERISTSGSPFISRGDDSGTHQKEKEIWRSAGIAPAGDQYKESGQGMGAVLVIAEELQAYTLCDRGTYLAMKGHLRLRVLFEKKDAALFNPYGIIAVNPSRHRDISYLNAMLLIAWMTSVEGQNIIREFKVQGQSLFIPDAIP